MTINKALDRIEQQLIQIEELKISFREHPDKLVELAQIEARLLTALGKIETQVSKLTGDNIDGSLN